MTLFEAISNPPLKTGFYNELFKKEGLSSFHQALEWIWTLPYGRNQNKEDYSLLFKEQKGTCSTKHGLIYTLAQECQVKARLILVFCKVHKKNEPSSAFLLDTLDIDYFPEAHTYIELEGQEIDLTFSNRGPKPFSDVIEKEFISLDTLQNQKIQKHQTYLKQWIQREGLSHSFEILWELREQWILKLGSFSTSIKN